MIRAFSIVALSLALAWAGLAEGVDGTWVAKVEMKAGTTVELTLNLKSDGDKLTGTVSGGARRAAATPIENGRIEGDKASFVTVRKGRNGERRFVWEATVAGDELKGTRTPEGGRRSIAFVAKRQS